MRPGKHPKIIAMMDGLQLDHHTRCIGIISLLRLFAAEYAPDGGVGRFSNHDLAEYLELTGDADELIQVLVDVELLIPDQEYRLRINREWEKIHPDMSEVWLSYFRDCGIAT